MFNANVADHFYIASSSEAIAAGGGNALYALEGSAAGIFTTQESQTIPLLRLFSPSAQDHFYVTNANEAANAITNLIYQSKGTAGFIYTTQVCNSVPFF
ncbi:hypothetical protein MVEN_01639900 [Mycena venus]|uniref:DUF5648 domain-containing protein n=1 Tax=Mycena venus TaxID=2733690 RepID=A0A8H7CRG4_9AGAR|nr:hypothetical protein MVEN_01639900 [Mycena venus]